MSESSRQVLVTYATAQSFHTSESWPKVYDALLAQLPLRNIHWKSPSRPSIRTIQELEVALVPLEKLRDDHTSQVPVTLLEKPLLNIYIVTCEAADLETYKSVVKRQIKDWYREVSRQKNQEWLIVHIIRPDARMPSGNFFQLKGSVLDKMRSDFNQDKRDRCVQLIWTGRQDNPTAWADLISKIKDGLLSAFDSAVSQREEEVKRSESQRQMPGWNFCTFFILKESLAATFEGVKLFEDALLQYDELEDSFYQVLKDKNLSWFGTLINPAPNDDSLPLLLISKKPYREFILSNAISVFDFRIYLLARQCAVLAKMGRINEVGRRSSAFLGAFGRRLREIEAKLPPFFVESWIFSSALSVVEQCDIWAADLTLDGSDLAILNARKGELLELTRNQLDIIGINVGHLPLRAPFSMVTARASAPSLNTSQQNPSQKISQLELLSSIEDTVAFYDLYINVTNRAIDMYVKAGRRKFALKLHGSLAALDVHRGRLESALITYTSLPAHYAPHMWTSLEALMLSQALDTHMYLDKPKDSEWIHILLAYLKTYVESAGMELLLHEEDKVAYISQLVDNLKVSADQLESDLIHPNHPAISIRISNNARIAQSRDGSFLDVMIQNHLPCTLPIEDISVTVAGPEADRFKFTSMTSALSPGKTPLILFCPNSSSGTYTLDSSEARMGRLLLQWSHRQVSASVRFRRGLKDNTILVRVPRDLRALNVRLCQPSRIELSKSPKLLVTVLTGRNHLLNATIRLSNTSGIRFNYCGAVSDGSGLAEIHGTDDGITIADAAADTEVGILVPHSDASALPAMKINVDVEYVTSSEPSISRTFHSVLMVPTSLPVAINVQDFFRGTRLFSKFTISTLSQQHVRVSSACLECVDEGLEGVRIVGTLPQKRGIVTITPAQPANFLFYLDSADGPVPESLNLVIKYRSLREEVEYLIKSSVEDTIGDSPSLVLHRDDLVKNIVESLDDDITWIESYHITGELNIPDMQNEKGEFGQALQTVKKSLHDNKHSCSPHGKWFEIKIPLDVPRMNIVAAARVRILSTLYPANTSSELLPPLYAGQPVSAVLSIATSFHWGSTPKDKGRTYLMRFDVEEMIQEWLVSGRKRGEFVAMDGGTYTVPITLIALHHGELSLPKVAITALPSEEVTMGSKAIPSTETYQAHGAEKVLVLPRGGRSTFVVGMDGE